MSHLFFTDVVILTASFLTILKWQTVYPSKYVFKGTSNYTFQKTQQTNLFILLKIKYPLTNHRHPTKPTNLQAPPQYSLFPWSSWMPWSFPCGTPAWLVSCGCFSGRAPVTPIPGLPTRTSCRREGAESEVHPPWTQSRASHPHSFHRIIRRRGKNTLPCSKTQPSQRYGTIVLARISHSFQEIDKMYIKMSPFFFILLHCGS